VQVTEITQQGVELRMLMSAADAPSAWDLRCEVREKLLGFLRTRYPEALPRTRVEAVTAPLKMPPEWVASELVEPYPQVAADEQQRQQQKAGD
jgi:hypothetical protein